MKISHLILLFLIPEILLGSVWHSASSGYWNQTTTWQGGIIPPLSSSDSIYIHHHVALNDHLEFTNGGFLSVDSLVGICGHVNITIGTNSNMINYGYCQIDTLFVPGGDVIFYPPGESIFSYYGTISLGGSFSVLGASLSVGPWFQCAKGPAGEIEYSEFQFEIFPNPFTEQFSILSKEIPEKIEIYDLNGKIISEFEKTSRCNLINHNSGMYIIKIIWEDSIILSKIFHQ